MSSRPTVAMTVWRRELPTYLGEHTDLYTLGTEYVQFISDAGLKVILIPECDALEATDLLASVSGLVLTGGEDLGSWIADGTASLAPAEANPRDATEQALLVAAKNAGLPVFGICRGMQLLAAHHGSRVIDLPHHRGEHPYGLMPENQLDHRHRVLVHQPQATSPKEMLVNSIHEQAISHCPEGFVVMATAEDGVIEGIESTTPWYAAGVQWHPEKMRNPEEQAGQIGLIAPFVTAVQTYQSHKTHQSRKEN
ncbi:gamma-glutamyl-gamma-aminobutyrate hydrolase family protein [Arthrobacter sp. 35W]|uniref:gamma-glutamyl-gamma-aminobutyrate hydrolase family protein n=1 Tax=Arthrobacter sp. 35W TaxID=1132441 RepID=UPI00047BD89C|nr:gamma-glutamyl-gamma-aminobutyrate hydrolase family protein [Arthrobacter sp. 35W]